MSDAKTQAMPETNLTKNPLQKLISDYCISSSPGETVKRALAIAHDPEKLSIQFGSVFMDNQAYAQAIQQFDLIQPKLKQWLEEENKDDIKWDIITNRIVSLLGKQAVRNVALSVMINKLLGTLPKKQTDRIAIMPRDQAKIAITLEDLCTEKNIPYVEIAFEAGFHFDILTAIMTKAKAPKDAIASIATSYEDGLKVAKIAFELGQKMGAFKYSKYVFAASVLTQIGKPLMYLSFPKELGPSSWAEFNKNLDKYKLRKIQYQFLMESKIFPFQHSEIGALFVLAVGLLPDLEKAIYFYEQPELLKSVDTDSYKLALLLAISVSIALTDTPAGSTVAPVNPALIALAKDIKLKESDLGAAMKKIKG